MKAGSVPIVGPRVETVLALGVLRTQVTKIIKKMISQRVKARARRD